MEGTPPVALFLLRQATTLGNAHHHRPASLHFCAASSVKGVSPLVQARALCSSATQLYLYLLKASPQQRALHLQQDATRAIQHLRKCSMLTRSVPDASKMRLTISATLEKVYTLIQDHNAAKREIKAALDDLVNIVALDRPLVVHWWAYFQCRAIANALVRAEPLPNIVRMAADTAAQCANHGDAASAVAFGLTQCHVALTSPAPDAFDLDAMLREAYSSLQVLSRNPNPTIATRADLVYLALSYFIMLGCQHIRTGDLVGAHNMAIKGLRKFYGKLRNLQKEDHHKSGLWTWLPSQMLSALACHVIIATNPNESERRNHQYALTALAKLGIRAESIPSFRVSSLHISNIAQAKSAMLAAALFEAAARLRLTAVDLKGANTLVSAAINAVFDDDLSRAEIKRIEMGQTANFEKILPRGLSIPHVLSRCSILLLAADYYYLRGRLSMATVSREFLEVVLLSASRFKDREGAALVSDTWQVAQSLYSLLKGTLRPGNIVQEVPRDQDSIDAYRREGRDTRFANKRVLGMAWFTIAVYQMRNHDVLDSEKALQLVLKILNNTAGKNDQVVANVWAIMSGLTLNRGTIAGEIQDMITNAIKIARSVEDSVTLSRALRQKRKWLSRTSNDPVENRAAAESMAEEYRKLRRKQQDVSRTLMDDPR